MPTPLAFDTNKFPPAPTLHLRLSFPGEHAATNEVAALIDTGSDFTLVPLQYLLQCNAPETRTAFVRGLFSHRQLVTLYLVDIHLETGVLVGVEVIGIDKSEDGFDDKELILGRNILNKLYLFLDGPQQQTYLLERTPRRL